MTGLSGSSTGMYVFTESYIAMITGAISRKLREYVFGYMVIKHVKN